MTLQIKYTNKSCKIITKFVYRHQKAWLFPEISFNHFHCLTKKKQTVSDISLIWDAAFPENRQRNRHQFPQACFFCQCCSFKSHFKEVLSIKPTLYIFLRKDFNSLKIKIIYILKTILINCFYTLPDKRKSHYLVNLHILLLCTFDI